MSSLLPRTQVAIVGAGVSGLAVARSLARHGLSVELLEARPRLGGRLFTVREPGWSLPLELGAEFVHGDPSPILALLGHGTERLVELEDRHYSASPRGLHPLENTWERFAKLMSPASAAGPNESALAFLERAQATSADNELARLLIEGFHAAPIAEVSAKSLAKEAEGTESGFKQYRVESGYDAVLRVLEAGLDKNHVQVRLGAQVKRIDWARGSVRLTVEHEGRESQVRAQRCVVTVPISLLGAQASGGCIEWAPSLDSRSEALAQLAMGQVVKLILRFNENPLAQRAPGDAEFLHAPDSVFPTFWIQSKGDQHQVTAWSGGPHAIQLALLSPAEIEHRALVSLATLLDVTPDILRSHLCGVHFHDFSRDPFALGAYSYVRPGPLDSRELQKRLVAPIEDTLFFAGEALDAEYPGTVAGALGSGEHAARRVLAAYNHDPH